MRHMNATDLETRLDNAVRPFAGLTCILCGQEDCVGLDLDDLKTFRCRECEEEFDRQTVESSVNAWTKVLAWIDMAGDVSRRVENKS
jgi:hypothetical protein